MQTRFLVITSWPNTPLATYLHTFKGLPPFDLIMNWTIAAVASSDPANNPVRKKAFKKLLDLGAAVVIGCSCMVVWFTA